MSAEPIEQVIGYQIEPKELWQAYEDNEVVADEDFKGKPITFGAKIKGVAKDPFGKVYVDIPTDQHGLFGLKVYLTKDDPNLRKLKKGQNVLFRAYPKGYVMKSVQLDGEVIMIEDNTSKGKKKK